MEDLRQILVIDDDTFLRMLVAVEIPGVELIEASRADEGFQRAVAERPDAILLDLRLPDGDGLDLLRRLRDAPMVAECPILVITAGHDESRRAGVLDAGADEYLAKPLEGRDLLARIERLRRLAPHQRAERRRELVQRLADGTLGDPDPVAPEDLAPPDRPADGRRGRGLRARFRRDR